MGDLARSLDSAHTKESTCRSETCAATIVWGVMDESGKRNPLDRTPNPDGRVVVVGWQATEYGMAPVVRVLKGDEVVGYEGARYTSHFATCPDAPAHRRR